MHRDTSSFRFCVYLLTSKNPYYHFHTYIGKTTNPPKRLRQHNGEIAGGAFKTETKRPWEMVLVVHSFPTQTKVLQFEWDWQHPEKGKRVRAAYEAIRGGSYGTVYSLGYRIRLLAEMLHQPAYCRLPLGVYITTHEYDELFARCPDLPGQVSVHYGDLADVMRYVGRFRLSHNRQSQTAVRASQQLRTAASLADRSTCRVCQQRLRLGEIAAECPHRCGALCHLVCLGKHYTAGTATLIPTVCACVGCGREFSWGEMIEHVKQNDLFNQ